MTPALMQLMLLPSSSHAPLTPLLLREGTVVLPADKVHYMEHWQLLPMRASRMGPDGELAGRGEWVEGAGWGGGQQQSPLE